MLAVTADDSSESVHHGQELFAYVTAYDDESLPLEFSESSAPANGVLSLNSDGSFSYSPNAGFTGYDSFEFAVTNGSDWDNGFVSIDVTNIEPSAFGGSESVLHDQALLAYLSESDADNDPLTYSIAAEPTNGTLDLNSDGSYVYTADPGYAGADSFDYFVTDGAATVTATLSIDVTNFAPVAEDDYFSTASGVGVSGNVLSNDHDTDSDDLTSWLVSTPADGVLMYFMSDGTFEYVPNAGFSGTDTFTYRANDGAENSEPVTVFISVTNDPPVAESDTYSFFFNLLSEIAAEDGLLQNDTDREHDPLIAVLDEGPAQAVSFQLNADGSFSYQPVLGWFGEDGFTYFVEDIQGNVSEAVDVHIYVSDVQVQIEFPEGNSNPLVMLDEQATETTHWSTYTQLETVIVTVEFDPQADPSNTQLVISVGNGRAWSDAERTSELTFSAPIIVGSSVFDYTFYVDTDGVAGSVDVTATVERDDPFLQDPPERITESRRQKFFEFMRVDDGLNALSNLAQNEVQSAFEDGLSPVINLMNAQIDQRISELNDDLELDPAEREQMIGNYNLFRNSVNGLPEQLSAPIRSQIEDQVDQFIDLVVPREQPAAAAIGELLIAPAWTTNIEFELDLKGDAFTNPAFLGAMVEVATGNFEDAEDYIKKPANFWNRIGVRTTGTTPFGGQFDIFTGVTEYNSLDDLRQNKYSLNINTSREFGTLTVGGNLEASIIPKNPVTGEPEYGSYLMFEFGGGN